MNRERFDALTARYPSLQLAVAGDFCLDRYFDIDPARQEISLETNLPVHNVMATRCQPGGAGTILNNLAALGVGVIRPVGLCGDDGEGWELRRALAARPGVVLDGFLTVSDRHTFTYSKPLLHRAGQAPEELSRLDLKNWTPTPPAHRAALGRALAAAAADSDGMIVLDQVDLASTGVVTPELLEAIRSLPRVSSQPWLADSRRGLSGWPALIFKMNARELGALAGRPVESLEEIRAACLAMAQSNAQPAIVTLAERGIVGALPDGTVEHVAAHPIRGPIDIVGAGDSVTANLTAALAAGATLREAMELAMGAASLVIHQLGTTGTASVAQLRERLFA